MANTIPSEEFRSLHLSCPSCGLAFHGQSRCKRCDTDLAGLMNAAAQAWKLRDRARRCLLECQFEQAARCAREALTVHRTPYGEFIAQLASRGANVLRRPA